MKKLWIVLFFLNSIVLFSQNKIEFIDTANIPVWHKMMRDPQANFYQTQRAFNLYWQNRKITKGCGFNVFKRWEYITSRYIDEKGNIKRNSVNEFYYSKQNEGLNQLGVSELNSIDSNYDCAKDSFWIEVGPLYERDAGRVRCIAFHPKDSNTIFVGTPSGGIWKSTNGGKHWRILEGYLPSLGVSDIAIDPVNPEIIYIGLSDPDAFDAASNGVYKTVNGGKNWFPINNGFRKYDNTVYKILIDPYNPQILLVSVCGGIYRTINGGQNWTISGFFCSADLVVNPVDRKYVYAVSQGEFCKSTDSGKTFVRISKGLSKLYNRYAIGVSKANPSYVYLLECDVAMEFFYCSKNYGDSFSVIKSGDNFNLMSYDVDGSPGTGQGWYCMDIAVNPNNEKDVYVGGIMIFNTVNEGAFWKVSADWRGVEGVSVHADIHALEYNPWNGKLYAATDGGVYYKEGKGWFPLSKGLGNRQVYKTSTCNNGKLLAGFQDNGSEYANLDNQNFIGVSFGDGLDNAIDYFRPNLRYTTYQNGVILKSGSAIASNGLNGINEVGDWLTPFVLVENQQNIMIAGFRNLWRSSNLDSNKLTYTNICNGAAFSNTKFVSDIESSPKNKNIVLFTRNDGTLFLSENALSNSVTWRTISLNSKIYDIQCDYKDENKIYVASGRNVYQSNDLGYSWKNISDSLPDININCIAIDSSSKLGGIYCGTSNGIYYRDDKLNRWIKYYKGFPENVEVLDIDISFSAKKPSQHRLYAGTYGRGIWKAPLRNYVIERPKENFSINKNDICLNDEITCSDSTVGLYLRHQWDITPSTFNLTKIDSNSTKVKLSFTKAGRYTIMKSVKNCLKKDSMFNEKVIVYNQIKNSFCVSKTMDVKNSGYYGIYNIQINQFFNSNYGTLDGGSYEDYTCKKLIKVKKSEKLLIKFKTNTTSSEFAKMYIDFNNDGVFDEQSEKVIDDYNIVHFDSIGIPVNAVLNTPIRARFISDKNWIPNACSNLEFGQTEDYSIVIVNDQANFWSDKNVACTNESIEFIDSSLGIYNFYLWDFGDGAIPRKIEGKGPHTVRYTTPGYKQVKLELNEGISEIKSNFIEVINGNKDTLMSKVLSGNYCLGDQMLLKSKYPHSVKNQYKWFKNNIEIDSGSKSFYDKPIYEGDTGNYFLVISNSCINDTTLPIKIYVHNKPVSKIQTEDINKCIDSGVFKFMNIFNNTEYTTCHWQLSDGRSFSDSILNVSFEQSGKHNVKLYVKSRYCIDSSSLTIEVFPLPDPSFKAQKIGERQYCFIPKLNSHKIYLWDFGDGDTSSLIYPTHTFSNENNYRIILNVHSNEGCLDSIQRTISNVELGVKNEILNNKLSIIPNPTEGLVKFNIRIAESKVLKIEILSMEGKIIDNLYNSIADIPNLSFEIDLNNLNLQPGIYIIKTQIGNEFSYLKLIKQ